MGNRSNDLYELHIYNKMEMVSITNFDLNNHAFLSLYSRCLGYTRSFCLFAFPFTFSAYEGRNASWPRLLPPHHLHLNGGVLPVLPVIKRNCRTARNQLIRPGIYGDRLARSCRSMLIPTFGCSTVGSILIYGVEYFPIVLVGRLVS